MVLRKNLKYYHWSGAEYLIENIPNVTETHRFLINMHLQKLVNEIEIKSKPQDKYSFLEYLHSKGIQLNKSMFHSSA